MSWTEQEFEALKKRKQVKVASTTAGKTTQSAKSLKALGRLPKGQMNNTEKAFAHHLELKKQLGEVQWFMFEAIKLNLAPNTTLTVDFVVLPASGILEMIDVKGSKAIFTDDARVKMKVAASMFPFVFKVAYPIPKKDGGGWIVEDI